VAGEAETLAAEVIYRMLEFGDVLKTDANLRAFYPQEVSETTKAENGNYIKLVAMAWGVDLTYRLPQEELW
jgi:hypothetical protein